MFMAAAVLSRPDMARHVASGCSLAWRSRLVLSRQVEAWHCSASCGRSRPDGSILGVAVLVWLGEPGPGRVRRSEHVPLCPRMFRRVRAWPGRSGRSGCGPHWSGGAGRGATRLGGFGASRHVLFRQGLSRHDRAVEAGHVASSSGMSGSVLARRGEAVLAGRVNAWLAWSRRVWAVLSSPGGACLGLSCRAMASPA